MYANRLRLFYKNGYFILKFSKESVELIEKLKEILKVFELYFIRYVSLKYKYANEIKRRHTPQKYRTKTKN